MQFRTLIQYSGALWGFPFLRPAEISETGEQTGRHVERIADELLLFFLTNSVVAVQSKVLHSAPPLPPDSDEVRAEPVGSRTESGVIKPSSNPGSGKDKNLHS